MHSMALAAGVLAAALVVGPVAAYAADLDYDRSPRDRLSSAYEDPRYRDLYGPDPGPKVVRPPHYAYEPTPPRLPPAYVYRDREPDYDDKRYRDVDEDRDVDTGTHRREYSYREEPRRYDAERRRHDHEPRRYHDEPRRYSDSCVPREEIRRRLVGAGWREFRDLELRGDLASVHARRPGGDLYVLRIDRCTGDVTDARPAERSDRAPYAFDDRRERLPRPYY